jgi:hypothetical protein
MYVEREANGAAGENPTPESINVPCLGRRVQIDEVLNGFVVQVGCQRVVFNSIQALTNILTEYYRDPRRVEEIFLKRAGKAEETLSRPLGRPE